MREYIHRLDKDERWKVSKVCYILYVRIIAVLLMHLIIIIKITFSFCWELNID